MSRKRHAAYWWDLTSPVAAPRSACPSRKPGWFSERDALAAVEEARKEAQRTGVGRWPVRVYDCPDCSSWHTSAHETWPYEPAEARPA